MRHSRRWLCLRSRIGATTMMDMRVVVLLVALGSIGCGFTGPSDDLTGYWIAQGAGHTLLFGLNLEQSGKSITGTACESSDGIIVYRNVPVTGTYPRVQYTVTANQTEPCCINAAGQQFSGKQDGTMDIVGTYANGDLRFKRSETKLCN